MFSGPRLLGPLGVTDRQILGLVVGDNGVLSRLVVPGLLAGSALTRWYGSVNERKRRGGHNYHHERCNERHSPHHLSLAQGFLLSCPFPVPYNSVELTPTASGLA